MKFRVEYAPRIARDRGKIRDYLIEESGSLETADRFLTRLLDACETLDSLPERFPGYPFAPDWRMMPFGNYLVAGYSDFSEAILIEKRALKG